MYANGKDAQKQPFVAPLHVVMNQAAVFEVRDVAAVTKPLLAIQTQADLNAAHHGDEGLGNA